MPSHRVENSFQTIFPVFFFAVKKKRRNEETEFLSLEFVFHSLLLHVVTLFGRTLLRLFLANSCMTKELYPLTITTT